MPNFANKETNRKKMFSKLLLALEDELTSPDTDTKRLEKLVKELEILEKKLFLEETPP